MQLAFDITATNRKMLAEILKNYTLEQLNKIPDGFSNNLIWNIGHTIVVQQLLTYKLSGLPTMVSDEMILKYRKGSRPEGNVSQSEADEIRDLLFTTIEKTKSDYNDGIFKNYHEFTNDYGFTIRTIEDAIGFNYYHEATHFGIILSLRKFV